ncbi:RNA-directed DNA polymerase, eukaryota, reverse transcriptase zinc-binding domain protein [Tanacetum coccineum]
MMDQMTSVMCKEGYGRLGYTKVLVEVDASKSYLDKVEINYVDAQKKIKMTKSGSNQEARENWNKEDNEGFVEVRNRKNKQGYKEVKQKAPDPNIKEVAMGGINQNNEKSKSTQDKEKPCETCYVDKMDGEMNNKKNMENTCNKTPPSLEKIWNVDPKKIVELRKSANKYVVLSNDMDALEFDGDKLTYDIKHYFKYSMNRMYESGDEEDIIEENNAANDLVADEIGRGKSADMIEFNDTLNSLEVEDICSSGFQGRGLRQGDPISPYLFTLVTEVFSLIMEKNIEESNEYGYHFGCKDLKLSHMCFADDLLVLCQGNKASIEVVKKSLKEFILPFKCGRLPVRYLGVSFLAKKLGVSDCKVLIDKVEDRINNLRNKNLSHAGRIQIIASVLASMQMYWASVYLLPITVSNDLEKLFKRFL